jgi:serine/threonine protein kinase
MAPSAPVSPIPKYVGKYRIDRQLGQGGMGMVFLAWDKDLGRHVALKVLHEKYRGDERFRERFRREMQVMAQLRFANLVDVYDGGEDASQSLLYLAMEYIEGRDLQQVIRNAGPASVSEACHWVRQAALGLHHAHEKGVYHRDVKPANLMLGNDGVVRVMDLGLAGLRNLSEQEDRLTQPGMVMGTPRYMAPEQRDQPERADASADIYSLGVTLSDLLAGLPPTAAPLPESVPPQLVEVIQTMRATAPEKRYRRAVEVAAALAPFCRQGSRPPSLPASSPSPLRECPETLPETLTYPPPAPPSPPRRRGWLIGLLVALALAAGGTVTYFALVGPRLTVQTPNGTVVLEFPDGLPDDAEVLVDGSSVKITRRGDKEAEVSVTAGEREVVVRSGGKEFRTKDKVVVPKAGKAPAVTVAFATRASDTDVGKTTKPVLGDDKPGPITNMTGHGKGCAGMAFAPNGLTAISRDGHKYHFWDLTKRRELSSWNVDFGWYNGGLVPVITLDGLAVLGSGSSGNRGDNGDIELMSVKDGKRVGGVVKNGAIIFAVAISPDGKKIMSADDKGQVRVWDFTNGKILNEFKHGLTAHAISFSPDGKYVLTGCGDKGVRLWNLEKDAQERSFEGHTDAVFLVGFSRDGRRAYSIAAGNEQLLRIWEVESGKELHKMDLGGKDGDTLTCAAFSADGIRALTGHRDGSVRVWDLKSQERLVVYRQHKKPVQAVAISPDGNHALSASEDGENHVWLYRLPPKK